MAENNFIIAGGMCPLAKLDIKTGESILIEQGAMVYKSPGLELKTRMNADGGNGFTRFVKAAARSMASGESFFITEVYANQSGTIALAPPIPGQIAILKVDSNHQYRLNDGAFLAMDSSVRYQMKPQSLGRAVFGKSGGLFVMETTGEGNLLINAFGTIEKISLNNDSITIDNGHVVAWDSSLNYNLHFEGGFLQSVGTGEGLVNTFSGTGDIYIQTLNIENFVNQMSPFIRHPER